MQGHSSPLTFRSAQLYSLLGQQRRNRSAAKRSATHHNTDTWIGIQQPSNILCSNLVVPTGADDNVQACANGSSHQPRAHVGVCEVDQNLERHR
jgi:hypothetical protein